jgi:serine/threonine protein kinase
MRSGSLLNSKIGDYQLVDFLGAGGMGEVYRAVHTKIGKVVAIKVLTLQKTGIGGVSDRFINEARIQGRLHHPGIATLFDYSDAGGHPCIVMEFVGGQTLDELIRLNGPFPPVQALKVFQAIAEAVGYIHSNSIVHRDIKSNNIKIDSEGDVKLLDFGIAKAATSPKLTAVGDVIGTFTYMAPELLKGGTADSRSDIWSLGILFYEMVSGEVPFRADTIGQLFEQIRKGSYVRATSLEPLLPAWVETIVSRCLKTNPAQRYRTVDEMLGEIRQLGVMDPHSTPDVKPAVFPAFRSYVTPIAALSFVTLLIVSGIYFWTNGGPSQAGITSNAPVVREADITEASSHDLKVVKVQVLEGEAEVYQNDQKVGVTPYKLTEQLGKRVDLVLKRSGYKDKRVEFSVTENKKEYTISLDPVSK